MKAGRAQRDLPFIYQKYPYFSSKSFPSSSGLDFGKLKNGQ
jgi:hypothetical protein